MKKRIALLLALMVLSCMGFSACSTRSATEPEPTPEATATPNPSEIPAATDSPIPTDTAEHTPTGTPKATETPTPKPTATPTPGPTANGAGGATVMPTAAPSVTATPAPGQTNTASPATPTPGATNKPASTPTPTPKPATTPTPTPKPQSSTSSPAPAGCSHNWQTETKTVHHEAESTQVWVVDKAAWDEEKWVGWYVCNKCGYKSSSLSVGFLENLEECNSGYHSDEEKQIIHHNEEGHYETQIIPAYDTQEPTGYLVCTKCGERKSS